MDITLTDFNWSPEAEAYVVGALLKAPLPTLSLMERMNATGDWFQQPAHAHIVGTVNSMRVAGDVIELETVIARLKNNKLWSFVGDKIIERCITVSKNTHNTLAYIQILKDRYIKRQAQSIIAEHTENFESEMPAEETLSKLRYELSLIDKVNTTKSSSLIADNIETKYLNAQRNKSIGIPSRWHSLQSILGGYVTGKVSFVAARPAQGKTTHGCNECLNCSELGIGSGIISIEMSEEEIREKVAADDLDFDLREFRHGKATSAMITALSLRIREHAERQLWISGGNKTIDKVCICTRDMAACGAKFVVLDHIHRIQRDKNESANERERLQLYSNTLTNLASELDIHFMILCQLKRESEFDLRRNRILPSMDHLKGTGDFEQDAHQVILIGRSLLLTGDTEYDDNQPMVVKVAKNRNGGLGNLDFIFAKSRQKLMPEVLWSNEQEDIQKGGAANKDEF